MLNLCREESVFTAPLATEASVQSCQTSANGRRCVLEDNALLWFLLWSFYVVSYLPFPLVVRMRNVSRLPATRTHTRTQPFYVCQTQIRGRGASRHFLSVSPENERKSLTTNWPLDYLSRTENRILCRTAVDLHTPGVVWGREDFFTALSYIRRSGEAS